MIETLWKVYIEMTTTRFITYKCNLCKRTIDEENRINSVKFTKCNITLGCEGKLYPIGSKNTRNIVATSAATDAATEDWLPREQVAARAGTVTQVEAPPISLITGNDGELTIAIPASATAATSLTMVAKKRQVDASSFASFIFYRGGTVSFISGRDNSAESKTLLFETSDTIEVFVNGIKLGSTAWSKDVTTQAITFSPALVGETLQIRINVTKAIASPSYNLTFAYNTSVGNSSWENVSQIKMFDTTYKVFTYGGLSTLLKIGEELQLVSIATGAAALTNSAYMLLAYSPYSPVDRELTSVIKFSEITSEWLSAPVSEKLNLVLATRVEKSVWPIIAPTVLVNSAAEKNQVAGTTDTVEKAINPYILGPT